MPKTYKDLHEEKAKLECIETLASVRQILEIIRICAEHSSSFDEFTQLIKDAIVKVEEKMK